MGYTHRDASLLLAILRWASPLFCSYAHSLSLQTMRFINATGTGAQQRNARGRRG